MAGDREQVWRDWVQMSVDSLAAAKTLQQNGNIRSSVSRCYYAVYQAVTAILLYQGLQPPKDIEDREAWSHSATPELLRQTVLPFWSQGERYKFSARLSGLYKLRIVADYKSKTDIENDALLRALKDVAYIVKMTRAAIPLEKQDVNRNQYKTHNSPPSNI